MLVSDLLHSCANDRVAEAAISSIGGDFALRIYGRAEDEGVSVGHLVAGVVREFAIGATERDWRDLASAVRGQDHPVLSGLQLILTRRLATLGVHGHDGARQMFHGLAMTGITVAAA